MEKTPKVRFLERLPLFIHLFFSLTVIQGFRRFAETFQWASHPQLHYSEPSDVLVPVSFVCALFWIVTDWVAYSWLIERHPYKPNLLRFFIDVLGFSLMFAVINFSFLAGQVDSYHYFIFAMAAWHFLIVFWHGVTAFSEEDQQGTRKKDAKGHGLRFITYFVLGLIYYFAVSVRVGEPFHEMFRYGVMSATFAAIIAWNTKRVLEVREQAS